MMEQLKVKNSLLLLVFALHILSGHIVSSIPEASDFNTASRHWNYWKNRLGFPYISNATKTEVLATLGHTAYLHCVVGNLGDRQVSWIRTRGIRVLAIGKVRYTQDTRFTPLHEEGNDVWVLKIQETRLSDAGLYECQVSYHEDVEKKLKMPVRLIVLDSFAVIKGSTERHVKEGSQLSLYCAIQDSSGPPSFVFWYRDDHVVNYSDEMGIRIITNTGKREDQFVPINNNMGAINGSFKNDSSAIVLKPGPEIVSSLHIKTVRPKDAGTYTCSPSNARNYSVVVHVIKGENLAMQRENEKQAIPVQQNQANSDVTLKPSSQVLSFIIQCLVFSVISTFSSIQVWMNKRPIKASISR